ncbi:MAG: acetyl-CoA carboxylase biotin carboxyl carrier protein [Bacteroidota bacterium]
MDINLLKKLIKMVEQSEITEFSVQEGDLKVKISKNSKSPSHVNVQPSFDYQNAAIQPAAFPKQSNEVTNQPTNETKSNLHEIKSPIVGTFYRAPAPDADSYVQIGDIVAPGSVLCIVEAMKLMNEIESDVSGKIVKILVENSTPVEYNQPLFLIETV